VRGPISREHQPEPARRLLRMATVAPGYRVHLWRRQEARPLELDPDSFDFGMAAQMSSQLQLLEWVEANRGDAPLDDEFRRLAPVFSPSEEGEGGPLALLRGARASRPRGAEALVLDNLPQFHFYSGWRAAVERRRRATPH